MENIKISANLGRIPLYKLGHYKPYFRTIDFPVDIKTDIEMYSSDNKITDIKFMAKFTIGDYVKLHHLNSPYGHNNNKKALITDRMQGWVGYTLMDLYTVIVDENMEVLDNIYDLNLELWQGEGTVDAVANEIWPPVCTCDLMYSGCKCGAMEKERQMILEGKNKGSNV